jgi:hypothetical protein
VHRFFWSPKRKYSCLRKAKRYNRIAVVERGYRGALPPHSSSAASVGEFGGLASVPGSWWHVFVCGLLRRL